MSDLNETAAAVASAQAGGTLEGGPVHAPPVIHPVLHTLAGELVPSDADIVNSALQKIGDANEATRSTQAATPAPRPSMGRIVIVRNCQYDPPDAPAIVTRVHADTGHIEAQIFRGDHLPHAGHNLRQIEPSDPESEIGWFWPPRS